MSNLINVNSQYMPPISSFEAYKNYVQNIPNLSEQEEKDLLIELKENNNLLAAQRLILSQLKNVCFIASKYKGYGLPQEDLVQEGNIGLMKAVKNFNIIQNVRLYTYAMIWIKSEIQTFIIKNWKLVKIATTKNLRKLFFSFRETQKDLINNGVSKEDLLTQISKKLNVSLEEANEMQNYLQNEDFYIESSEDEDSEKSSIYQIPYNKTPEKEYEQKHDKEFYLNTIEKEVNKLNEKQKQVLEYRFYTEPKLTHKEISKILNISSERVRQIENEVLIKLKKVLLK